MAMGTSPLLNETGLEGEAGGTMLGRLASRRQWRESRCGQLDVAVDEAMEVVKATLRCEPRLDKTPGAVLSAPPPHPPSGGRVVHQCRMVQAHSLLGWRVRGGARSLTGRRAAAFRCGSRQPACGSQQPKCGLLAPLLQSRAGPGGPFLVSWQDSGFQGREPSV